MILAGGGAFILTEAVGRLKGGAHPPDAAWYAFAVLGIAVDVSRTLISFRIIGRPLRHPDRKHRQDRSNNIAA
jgi:hypothetical protein